MFGTAINESKRRTAGTTSVHTATSTDAENRPTDPFVTREALQRRTYAPNLAEATSAGEPSKVLADDPCVILPHLLEIARELCKAGTAGLSLLRHTQAGHEIVRWDVVSGALARYQGRDTPRDASPCGLCLDAGMPILVSRPERSFSFLHDARPPIVEELIVPLYDSMRNALGTLWIAHHDGTSHITSDDARVAERLAVQLVLTLNLMEHARERRLQRNQAESESRQALALRDVIIQEVNHRTKNTLQLAASLLSLHARTTASAQVREALLESHARLHLLADAHEALYWTADSTPQTVFMPRLLQTLSEGLRQSFARAYARVQLDLKCDAIALPVDEAIPIALFANEAVTNAYKHAFPNDSSGKIALDLTRMSEKALVLRIADTGIGLDVSCEGGMGRKLIRTFAAQLGGTLDITAPADARGTVITLTIQRPAGRATFSER